MQTLDYSQHTSSWLEESILHYLKNTLLPEELVHRPKRLVKLFEELLLNTTYHTTDFEELKNRLFEIIVEKALDSSLKLGPILKVIRSISHLDTEILNQSKLTFFITPYRIEGNKLLWIINSPFVKALLSNTFLESEKKEIQLKEIPFEDFKQLNAFVNEGSIDFSDVPLRNLFSLLQSAEYFQIDEFKKNCLEEIKKRVSIQTIGDMLYQLSIQDMPSLYSKCQDFLRKSFVTLTREDDLMVMSLEKEIGIETLKKIKNLLKSIKFKINITRFIKKGNTSYSLHYKKKLELAALLREAKRVDVLTQVDLSENDFSFENFTILNNNDSLLDKISYLNLDVSSTEIAKLIFRSCTNLTHFSGILNSDQLNLLLMFAGQLTFLEFLEGSEFDSPPAETICQFIYLKELRLCKNVQTRGILPVFKHLQDLQQLSLYTETTAIHDLKQIFKEIHGKFRLILNEISNPMNCLTEEILSQSFLEDDGYRVSSYQDSVVIFKDPMLEASHSVKRQRDESNDNLKKQNPKPKKIKTDQTTIPNEHQKLNLG